MALKSPTRSVPPNMPAFEEDDEGVATMVAEAPAPAPAEAPAPTPAPALASAETAVVVAAKTAVAAANAFTSLSEQISSLKNVMSLGYGDAPTFKARSGGALAGGASSDENTKLGRWAKVTLLSWSDRQEISPGSDAASAKKYVAYSDDNVHITSAPGEDMDRYVGLTIVEYLKELRETLGMPAAHARRMVDLLVFVHETEKDNDYVGGTVVLTLPPSSIRSFDGYMSKLQQLALCQSRGLPVKIPEDPLTFYVYCESAKKGDNEWTKLGVSPTLPKDL